MIHATDLL